MGKGSIVDIFLIIFIVFSFFIVIIISGFLLTSFTNTINDSGINFNMTYLQKGSDALQGFNSGLIFIAFGSLIAVVLSAFYIKSHPAFFVISLIVFIILMVITPVFTNIADAFATSDQFSDTANNFDLAVLLMRNLPIFAIICTAVVIIILYGKSRGAGSEI